MELIDLHIHTTASDGTLTPRQVVLRAKEKGLRAIAVTDHDTIDGIVPSQNGLEVIAGIEISAEYCGKEIHILGYLIDPREPTLLQTLDTVVKERQRRNAFILDAMAADGYALSLEELRKNHPDAVLGRPHIAAALVEKGYATSIRDAFDRFLGEGTPYYLRRVYLPYRSAVQVIRGAGGVAVLAHPMEYGAAPEELERLIADLKTAGVAGLEAIHPSHTKQDIRTMFNLAGRHGLFCTGGSDFHGAHKPGIEIGGVKVPLRFLDALKAAAGQAGRRA
jgi:predicted metal-dependent phosphoesterase TrpH